MNNVIRLDNWVSKKSKTIKLGAMQHESNETPQEFSDRMNRIKYILEKINILMADLKKAERSDND